MVQYGDQNMPLTNLSHYAVGKIENNQNSLAEKELTIHTATNQGQDLQVYVISYRGFMPVMNIETKAARNQSQDQQPEFISGLFGISASVIINNAERRFL